MKSDQITAEKSARSGHWDTLKALGPYLWPRDRPALKTRIVIALASLALAKTATVVAPIFFGRALDHLQAPDAVKLTLALVGAYVLARFLSIGFAQFRDWISAPVGSHAQRRVALAVFRHVHALSLRFHLERRMGGLSRAIERGVQGIDTLIRFTLFNIGPTILELTFIIVMFWTMFGAAFPLVTVVTVALYIAVTFVLTSWRARFRREMNNSDSEANTKAIDSLINFETVKYFGNEEHEAARYDRALAGYERAATRTIESLAALNTGQAIVFNAGLGALLLLAAYRVAHGEMTVGSFGAINVWLMQLFQPLNLLGTVYREIQQALIDMENMFALLGVAPDIRDRPDARPLAVNGAEVRFDDVSFSYDPDRQILFDVCFAVPAGRKLAIVGPSGSGKSTISRLLFRFYDAGAGRISIDGQDIAAATQASLRAAIGIVPQDTVLFNDTIRYNIRYGRPGASDAEVEAAARVAQIHDFIEGLPKGYDTMVGERGLKLSGGEKQRVAIARTVLKNPPILVLDEATSALDSHTEREIQASLGAITRGRTTLVVAHRLSTVVDADEILVLDKGCVIERGTHEALLAKDGAYAAMWRRQIEAAAVEERLERLRSDTDSSPHEQADEPSERAELALESSE